MELLDIIKRAGTKAVDAGNPVNVMIGTVTKASPLEVNVSQGFTLSEDFLIITERVTKYEQNLKHKHGYIDTVPGTPPAPTPKNTEDANYDNDPLPKLTIRHGLKVGDKVVLLRVQGGQQFVVLDKVVS